MTEFHQNFMGGTSFDINNPLTKLKMLATSCFFGEPGYYSGPSANFSKHNKSTSKEEVLFKLKGTESFVSEMENAIDNALSWKPEETLQFAVELRNQHNIRTTSQVILVRAANHSKLKGTGLVRKYGPQICVRPDEPSVGLQYHFKMKGKEAPIPNSLKRLYRDILNKMSPFALSKYKLQNQPVKMVDVVNLVHPKRTEGIDKLVKGELSLTENTWESLISKKGSNKGTWTEAIPLMGHMALLRNLRNLEQHEVPTSMFLEKLKNGVIEGKQLPFRYYSAYSQVTSREIKNALEECMVIALNNLPNINGRTLSLCDNSASAQGATTSSLGTIKISTIANLTAILTAMKSDYGEIGIFGDKLKIFNVNRSDKIFETLNKAEREAQNIGGGTENGIWLALNQAIKEKIKYDNIFIMSDMQAGHGQLYGINPTEYSDVAIDGRYIDVHKLIMKYKATVNPDVNVFMVQVAGYSDTLVPEFYRKTYVIGGWSEGIIKFASEISNLI